ncbi:MAG: DedA family protein [Proteobacteria bacterium]|nr:DedA family protein [Pseudomonadota bacterium]
MLKRIYDKTLDLARHPKADRWLAGVSFIESSIFPIPPDVLLIPMCLEKKAKAFYYAGLCTIASVLGGLAGYAIGFFFWATIGDPLIAFYGLQNEFALFEQGFVKHGFWIVFVFGITFFPYKVITIASGVVKMDPVLFIVASLCSRALRFYIEAGLLWKYGEKIRAFVEKRLALSVSVAVLLVVLIVIGYKIFKG